MKAQRLASGHYRCQVKDRETGKRKSFTAETAEAAVQAALNYQSTQGSQAEQMLFKDAYELFLSSRSDVYSPNTIREYQNAAKVLSQFNSLRLSAISDMMIQKWVNSMSARLKPKTVSNYFGYLSAIMSAYMPQRKLIVVLPKKTKTRAFVPSETHIMALLSYLNENDKELCIVVQLGCFCGMRRGEISALDIDHIYPEIGKAHVEYSMARLDGTWIKKKPKTFESDRYVPLPAHLIRMIQQQGYVTSWTPQQITKHFICALRKVGLPHFRFHDLRHFSVSKQHSLNIPDVEIMAFHGFSSDYTMKNVYRQVMDESKAENDSKWMIYTAACEQQITHK